MNKAKLRKVIQKGFIEGPKSPAEYINDNVDLKQLSEEEQAQLDEIDEGSFKDKITKSILMMLKKKGPPPPLNKP